ncbi:MAG TPA: glycosyl transferase, partial [Elusimicrobia bacterium]|nr:glycosyl transferase [Elusimicrobiota bacterium]
VIFTGFRNDIPEMLSVIDIFVLASYCEAFGLVLVEAMAMKKTVIGTDAGGVPEIIEHNKSGLLVPPRDYKNLARAIRNLVSDWSLCRTLSQNARETVEKKFSLEKHLQGIEKIYQSSC